MVRRQMLMLEGGPPFFPLVRGEKVESPLDDDDPFVPPFDPFSCRSGKTGLACRCRRDIFARSEGKVRGWTALYALSSWQSYRRLGNGVGE